MKPIRVYIAGPISSNPPDHTRTAIHTANYLMALGYVPYVPHLTVFWEMVSGQKDWETWLTYDEKWLAVCDVLLRLPGESRGADREVAFAGDHGIPVVYGTTDLERRFPLTAN